MSRTITVTDLKTLINSRPDITLLDVRRRADYDADAATIPGAAWRDPEQVATWSKDLPKNNEVVIYCARGGSVSNKVLDQLKELNISAKYIEGGIAAWKEHEGKS